MKDKYTHIIIRKFFEKSISKDLQYKFRKWLVECAPHYESRETMLQIWDNTSSENDNDNDTSIALKKIHKSISDYESKKRKSKHKNFALAAAVAAAILLPVISSVTAYKLKKETIVVKETMLIEHFVPNKERKQIVLPDSTEVWLNSGSLLIYASAFEGKNRTVFLNGEAHFTVTEDASKPFIVKTSEVDIEVLGTVFSIESYTDKDYSITTLEKGKVKVKTKSEDAEPIYLSPNEQLIFDKTSKTFEKKIVSATKENLWTKGYLVFQGNSFDDMMRTIERQFGVKVNYNKEMFKGRNFTMRFTPEEDINQVFSILQDLCGFEYKIKDNVIQITNNKKEAS